jgi:hypothetical protein
MRAKPFFKTRFAVRPRKEPDGDHWLGGTGEYQGAVCPICKVALLLLWDVNWQDPVLRAATRGKLKILKRLPLYYCFGCFSQLSYTVDDRLRVNVVHKKDGQAGNGPPYDGFPEVLPRRPIILDAVVPDEARSTVRKWTADPDDLTADGLTKKERRVLEDFFGHPMFLPRFMYHHQIGGVPLLPDWDDAAFACPNKKCPGGLVGKTLGRAQPMRFLAGIINDPPGGLPLMEPLDDKTRKSWSFFGGVHYQICDKCLTITTAAYSD